MSFFRKIFKGSERTELDILRTAHQLATAEGDVTHRMSLEYSLDVAVREDRMRRAQAAVAERTAHHPF